MNSEFKEKNNKEVLKKTFIVIGLIVISFVLCLITIKRIQYFSYKEVEATLISHGEIRRNTEYSDDCNGTFEYFVDGKKYETSFLIDYHYCFKGYKQLIYYDVNNPSITAKDRSIFVLLVIIFFDILTFVYLIMMIKELYELINNKKKVNKPGEEIVNKKVNKPGEEIVNKKVELNHLVYGKYELMYDSSSVPNKYSQNGNKCLDISFAKKDLDYLQSELEVYFPLQIINGFLNDNYMNRVLDQYHKLVLNNIDKILDVFIKEEMNDLIAWYNVPDSPEGVNLIKRNKELSISGFTVDSNLNIVEVKCTYKNKSDNTIVFMFTYNIKDEKVDNVDVAS